jgi:hypothetical protein
MDRGTDRGKDIGGERERERRWVKRKDIEWIQGRFLRNR